MATNWIMNYMVAQVTPPGISNLGYRFWIIWAVICASFVPITYFFYPETANRTLEDIDRYFEEHRNIFVHRDKFATQLQRPEVWAEMDQEFARRVNEEKLGPGVGERQIEVHVAGEDDKAAATNNNNGGNVEYLEK